MSWRLWLKRAFVRVNPVTRADGALTHRDSPGASSLAEPLLEDYKLKFQFATDVLNRYQNQMQIMLALEAAVATALILSSSGKLSNAARWIVLVEVMLSAVWLSVGIQGYFRVRNSHRLARAAAEEWSREAGLKNYTPPDDRRGTVRIGWVGPTGMLILWLAASWYFWVVR